MQDKNKSENNNVEIKSDNDNYEWKTIGIKDRRFLYSYYIEHNGKKPPRYWNIGIIFFDKEESTAEELCPDEVIPDDIEYFINGDEVIPDDIIGRF
ncbi:MAG: hypothetical protein MPK62_09325 [Alphaproteobacteria bacterium]|nr:hypothetical protein [Alphaproteobacteria bacterium]